jgi:hypothetical protein
MQSNEELYAEICAVWLQQTGLIKPHASTVANWIELADSKETIFRAIAKTGRKCAEAARKNNAMVAGQAVCYTANIIRNKSQAQALEAVSQ